MGELRTESARTRKLIELSRRLAATGDLQSILSTVIDALRDLLDADRATVFEFDPKTNELTHSADLAFAAFTQYEA